MKRRISVGRYTHKIAISNHRLKSIAGNTVTFNWKDYREGGKKKVMTLEAMEFVRRFAMHILPKGFVRIRHYGILSSTAKRKKLPEIKAHFSIHQHGNETEKAEHCARAFNAAMQCPKCKQMTMMRVLDFDQRGPPSLHLLLNPEDRQIKNRPTSA